MWQPNVKDAQLISPAHDHPQLGDQFELTTLLHDRASVTKYELTKLVPHTVIGLKGVSDTAVLDTTITLRDNTCDADAPRTHVEYRIDARLKGRLALVALLLRPVLEELASASTSGLKAACVKRFGGTGNKAPERTDGAAPGVRNRR